MRGIRGLDGTLRLEVLTDRPDERFALGSTLLVEEEPPGAEPRTLRVRSFQPASPGSFARFDEIRSREEASALVGRFLAVALPAVPRSSDPISWDEVIGLTVRDSRDTVIGEVVDCYRAGGAEVYLVRTPDGGELDLPAVASVITTFDPRAGVIIANLDAMEIEARPPRAGSRAARDRSSLPARREKETR